MIGETRVLINSKYGIVSKDGHILRSDSGLIYIFRTKSDAIEYSIKKDIDMSEYFIEEFPKLLEWLLTLNNDSKN